VPASGRYRADVREAVKSGIGVSLYLPADVLAELRELAAKHERSLSWVVAWWWRKTRVKEIID
jgi:uncharacterized small protein (TIGR04563 family)